MRKPNSLKTTPKQFFGGGTSFTRKCGKKKKLSWVLKVEQNPSFSDAIMETKDYF